MRIRVQGGQPLNGVYTPAGNSNAAIHCLAAALLTDQPVRLDNVPKTASVVAMLELAELLGAQVDWHEGQAGAESNGAISHSVTVTAAQIGRRHLTHTETQGFIGALLYLVPIIVRRGYARLEIDFPLNRVRTHLEALRDLGIDVSTSDGGIELRSVTWEFKDILLTQASVTATSMVMMLAATLGHETVIRNAACEPHIQSLGDLLERMGAQVQGLGSNVIRIWGVPQGLHGTIASLGADTIETASIAAIAAMCKGRVQITDTQSLDLRLIDRIYRRLGVSLDLDEENLYVPRHGDLIISTREEDVDASIETAPWPGFPSDLVAIATVLATQARGTVLIHEKMFNDRLLFVDKLIRMGAQIVLCDPHRAIVVGPSPLRAIYMDTPDVRIGLGMLGAALVAKGESVIDNAQAISRSFEHVLVKLQALGAQIEFEGE
jgi:UDP-N-acetylglucosamine 1-carboxyvinyltransferase